MSVKLNRVFRRMQERADVIIEERLTEQLPNLIALALKHAEIRSVTGNTMNSYAVALFHDRQFVGFYSSYLALGKAPTRVTLQKGERYDLPYYWGGDAANRLHRTDRRQKLLGPGRGRGLYRNAFSVKERLGLHISCSSRLCQVS